MSDLTYRLATLIGICCDNIEELLNKLDVNYRVTGKRIYGACPVHCGDNPRAWNLYPDGDIKRGYWVCYSHHCEQQFKSDLIGFITGVMQNIEQEYTRTDAINFMLQFCGFNSIDDVKPQIKKRSHINDILAYKMLDPVIQSPKLTREYVRSFMSEIPASYYIKRGYSSAILESYDVGFIPAVNRIGVPVYDNAGKFIVGVLKRSIFPKCDICGCYHINGCPQDKFLYSKWINTKGFGRKYYLYNYWKANKYIRKTQTIILVEGPGDVWKLEECGIHNSVAVMGTSLTEYQQAIIDSSWAINIIIAFDNDDAGKKNAQQIYNVLRRSYNVMNIEIPYNDIGETPQKDIVDIFGGYCNI